METNAKKIYNSIDLAKFIAAILVVAIHTQPFKGTDYDYYFTCFCRLAVPFFFVASSYFFFRRPSPDVKKYTKRLGTLYLMWFILELPIVYKRFFVDFDHSLPLQILNFFKELVFNNTWWASWYIMASILSVTIIVFIQRRYRLDNKSLLIIAVGGYFLSLISSGYYGVLDSFFNERLQFYHKAFSWCFHPANSFIVALIYVMIGKILSESEWQKWSAFKRESVVIVLLVVCLCAGMAEVHLLKWSAYINDAFVFLPFVTIIGFVILLKTDIKIKPSIALWLRNLSILIYILHPLCQFGNSQLLALKNGDVMFALTVVESLFML